MNLLLNHTRNALCRVGLHSERALRRATDADLLMTRNIGERSLALIKAALEPGNEWLLHDLLDTPSRDVLRAHRRHQAQDAAFEGGTTLDQVDAWIARLPT